MDEFEWMGRNYSDRGRSCLSGNGPHFCIRGSPDGVLGVPLMGCQGVLVRVSLGVSPGRSSADPIDISVRPGTGKWVRPEASLSEGIGAWCG